MDVALRERLDRMAGQAPDRLPPGDLWAAGVRRQRVRRAGGALAVACAALLVGGLVTWLPSLEDRPPQPVDVPFSEQHLPRTLYTPDPWTPGTAETGAPGPLAAIALARRNRVDGLTGEKMHISWFGVSAVDGSAVFLDLPGDGPPRAAEQPRQATLSPDGTKLGYARYEQAPGRRAVVLTGWAVLDTLTGRTVELEDDDFPRPEGTDIYEISFSGDSRHLLTNYARAERATSRNDQLVVWDAETGERMAAEGPGHYWLPGPATSPDGVAWTRGRRAIRFDPATGTRQDVTLPHKVVEASWGPDDRGFAWIASTAEGRGAPVPWHLRVGPDERSATRRVDPGFHTGRILGWRDAATVVVSPYRGRVAFVDVHTGVVTTDRLRSDDTLGWETYAADLWANDLVPGVPAADVPDPRWWMRRGVHVAGGLLVLLAAGLGWVGRRRGRA